MLLGDFDFNAMYDQDPTNAVLFFWSFYIFMYYLLLNMFLAIVVDAYSEVTDWRRKQNLTITLK